MWRTAETRAITTMVEEKFDVEKEYKNISSKYNLPEFNDLNKDFEISTLENKAFVLSAVRKRMNEKLIFFCKILENILYPTIQNPVTNYESSFFDEEIRKNLVKVHKQLLIFDRHSLSIDVNPNEQEDVDFINNLSKEWSYFKKELKKVVEIMQDSWKKENKEQGEGYFGWIYYL